MYFTPQLKIVPMNECIYQAFLYGTFWIFRIFKAIIRRLAPSLL
jgi:hypothetical protein